MKMKKLFIAIVAAITLSACGGTKEYDSYIATLAAQPAIIDTISTPESYGAYIDSLKAITSSFEALGVKLNDTQSDEINALGIQIAEAMRARYAKINVATSDSTDIVTDIESPKN